MITKTQSSGKSCSDTLPSPKSKEAVMITKTQSSDKSISYIFPSPKSKEPLAFCVLSDVFLSF